MFKRLIVFILIGISHYTYSQTIINAERLSNSTDSLSCSIQISYSGTRGNAITDQFNIEPSLIKISLKNSYKLFGGYNTLSESSNILLNSGFLHARHGYNISSDLKTFEFYQIQFNDVLLLTKREAYGAGLRHSTVNRDSLKIDFGVGAIVENEFLDASSLSIDEVAHTRFIRGTFLNSIKMYITNYILLDNIIYFQPHLNNFEDFRLLNDFSISFKLNKKLSFIYTFTIRYDSRPPLILSKYDTYNSFGINYTLSK